jgi:hypothetical protein
LCINAIVFFVLNQSLPKTDDFLPNEVSEMATQNMKTHDHLQLAARRGLDRLRNSTYPVAVQSSIYLSWALATSDTVYHRFENAHDDPISIRILTDILYKLPPMLQRGLGSPWHQKMMKRDIDRFVRLPPSSDSRIRRLRLETLEGWIFNGLQEYADSANNKVKGDAMTVGEYSKPADGSF